MLMLMEMMEVKAPQARLDAPYTRFHQITRQQQRFCGDFLFLRGIKKEQQPRSPRRRSSRLAMEQAAEVAPPSCWPEMHVISSLLLLPWRR